MASSPMGRMPRRPSRLPVVMTRERAQRLTWLPVLDSVVSVPVTAAQRAARAVRCVVLAAWMSAREPSSDWFVRADS